MLRSALVAVVVSLLVAGQAVKAERVGVRNPPPCSAEQGQLYIDEGRYKSAIREFTCLIDAQPTAVEGYRGRIEAELLLGKFSDAVRDYTRVTAFVLPVHPDAESTILAGYDARLAIDPENIAALTGKSFAYWWFFQYSLAVQVINELLDVSPNDVYGNLFRGSSRVLLGSSQTGGATDLENAIALDPESPDVHYVVADAYTYGGQADPQRAFDEASLALDGGLDTPRVHAILAASYLAFGNPVAAAIHIERHLELVTTELVTTSPLAAGSSLTLNAVPGRTFDIPLPVVAGESVSIGTSSHDFVDTILALLAPDGSPVLGSDDYKSYFAGFQWVAPATGTYRLRVTSFEAVSTGVLRVTRN